MHKEYETLVADLKTYLLQMKNSSLYVSCNTFIDKTERHSSPNLVLPAQELKEEILPPLEIAKPIIKKEIKHSPAVAQTAPVIKTPRPEHIDHFVDLIAMMKKTSPHLKISDYPLLDKAATEAKNEWKIELHIPIVPIFTSMESKEIQTFLHQVAKAIHITFCPCNVLSIQQIEKKMKINDLFNKKEMKLIIVSKQTLHGVKSLLTRYKIAGNGQCYIHDIPAIILNDASVYFSSPMEKKKLWNEICKHLAEKK
ncbi:MAG: hypothetical protein HY860_01220 [Chlamydiales bacterium]|nr:hypothetical protein [Chlamydiales bacterium]